MCALLKEEGSKQRNALEKWNTHCAAGFDWKLIIGPKKQTRQTEGAKCFLFGYPVYWKLIQCNDRVGRAEHSNMAM